MRSSDSSQVTDIAAIYLSEIESLFLKLESGGYIEITPYLQYKKCSNIEIGRCKKKLVKNFQNFGLEIEMKKYHKCKIPEHKV